MSIINLPNEILVILIRLLDQPSLFSLLLTSRQFHCLIQPELFKNVVLYEKRHERCSGSDRPRRSIVGLYRLLEKILLRPEHTKLVKSVQVVESRSVEPTNARHLIAPVASLDEELLRLRKKIFKTGARTRLQKFVAGEIEYNRNTVVLLLILLPELPQLCSVSMQIEPKPHPLLDCIIKSVKASEEAPVPLDRLKRFECPSRLDGKESGVDGKGLSMLLNIPFIEEICGALPTKSLPGLRMALPQQIELESMLKTLSLHGFNVFPPLIQTVLSVTSNLRSLNLEWEVVNIAQVSPTTTQLFASLTPLASSLERLGLSYKRYPDRLLCSEVGFNRQQPGPLSLLSRMGKVKHIRLGMVYIFGAKRDVFFTPMEIDRVAHRQPLDLPPIRGLPDYIACVLPPSVERLHVIRHDCEKLAPLVLAIQTVVIMAKEVFPKLRSIFLKSQQSDISSKRPHCINNFRCHVTEDLLPELEAQCQDQGIELS